MKKKIELNLPANLRFSSLVRSISQDVFSFAGFGKEWCGRLKLVVDELFMNAVCYGSTENESIVSMVFSYDEKTVEFTISDDGSGSNKITADELKSLINKNIENNSITQTSGRGLAMITNLWTDQLDVTTSSNGGILISFVKKIESTPPPPPPMIRTAMAKPSDAEKKGKKSISSDAAGKKPAFVIELRGDIDPFNIEKTVLPVHDEIEKLPDQATLVLDLKNINYINSTFIGHIASWYKDIHKKNGHIILRNTHNQIRDVLDLVGLGRVLSIES